MNVVELIRECEQRRAAILAKLPPELQREFAELEITIRHTRAVMNFAKAAKSASRNGSTHQPSPTVPQAVDNPPKTAEIEEVPPDKPSQVGESATFAPSSSGERISLEARKRDLIGFLKARGPMRRNVIKSETGIPNGSLSNLLQEPEFEKNQSNEWRVKED